VANFRRNDDYFGTRQSQCTCLLLRDRAASYQEDPPMLKP
jgi:hypothetical protein